MIIVSIKLDEEERISTCVSVFHDSESPPLVPLGGTVKWFVYSVFFGTFGAPLRLDS